VANIVGVLETGNLLSSGLDDPVVLIGTFDSIPYLDLHLQRAIRGSEVHSNFVRLLTGIKVLPVRVGVDDCDVIDIGFSGVNSEGPLVPELNRLVHITEDFEVADLLHLHVDRQLGGELDPVNELDLLGGSKAAAASGRCRRCRGRRLAIE
jgi:hypothetical protein